MESTGNLGLDEPVHQRRRCDLLGTESGCHTMLFFSEGFPLILILLVLVLSWLENTRADNVL